jgi:hypothetical protein
MHGERRDGDQDGAKQGDLEQVETPRLHRGEYMRTGRTKVPLPRSLRLTIVIAAALLIGSAMFVAAARTYTVLVLLGSSYAIWNDEQLVVFVRTTHVGTRATVFEQLENRAKAALHVMAARRQSLAAVVEVACLEGATVRHMAHVAARGASIGLLNISPPVPRFVDGRPLVFGGFWNGREIEHVDPEDFVRLRKTASAADAGRWKQGVLLARPAPLDLTLTFRGDVVTLKGTRTRGHAFVDLIRGHEAPMRILDVALDELAVSAREFEATFEED